MSGQTFMAYLQHSSQTVSECMMRHTLTEVLVDPDTSSFCYTLATVMQDS